MDLIRDVLLAIEKTNEPISRIEPDIPCRSDKEVAYHIMLLSQAGLIGAHDASTVGEDGFNWFATNLTWQGHEYLDTIRDPEIWRKTKEGAQKVGGFSLDLMTALAKGLLKKKIQNITGVELDY